MEDPKQVLINSLVNDDDFQKYIKAYVSYCITKQLKTAMYKGEISISGNSQKTIDSISTATSDEFVGILISEKDLVKI